MIPQAIRIASGLFGAVVLAAVLHLVLIGLSSQEAPEAQTLSAQPWTSLASVLIYGLPFAALAAAAAELLRIRHLAAHLATGTLIAAIAAYLSVRGEPMNAPAFSGGALASLGVLAAGLLPALVYWGFSGRRAGWRGDAAEHAARMTAEAFRTASTDAHAEPCKSCAALWSAVGVVLFALFSWLSIEASGLRGWLVTETEHRAVSVLKSAGYAWASFKVEGSRGVLTGLAPDEVQKRAAFDSVREALAAVTGFPGVVAEIDNETVARLPMSEMNQQLADASRRENEAMVAAEAARIAAESARAGEADAKRSAEEQARTAEIEIKRKLEEQAQFAEGELKRKLEEQASLAQAEIKRKLEEQVRAAEEETRKASATAEAAAAAEPAAPEQQPVAVAAVEPSLAEDTKPEAGEPAASQAPAVDAAPGRSASGCSPQDAAIVESSRIHFDMQVFDVRRGDAAELDRLAASLRACAPRSVLVTGHSDVNRDSVFNPALGLQRAQSVREQLIARGVPAGLVVASAASKEHANDYEVNAMQGAVNRRAEFRFLEVSEVSRDATLDPDERATTCESDLAGIMAQSIIHFPSASARVSEQSMPLIRKLAGAIQTCGSVIVTVEGHTDKIGAESYNQGLSEARSNAVREALAAAGADPTRLAARGFAASRPYDAAESAQAYALNRRIEFKVSGKFTSTNTGGP